jgi:hypothetical protein
VPLLVSPSDDGAGDASSDAQRILIMISPHNEQIRYEFARGFEKWHFAKFGQPVKVIWNRPGGTSEIRRMLEAQYRAALRDNRPVGGSAVRTASSTAICTIPRNTGSARPCPDLASSTTATCCGK